MHAAPGEERIWQNPLFPMGFESEIAVHLKSDSRA